MTETTREIASRAAAIAARAGLWGMLTACLAGSVGADQSPPSGATHEAIRTSLGFYEDAAVSDLLQEVGGRVAAATRYGDRGWSFWLIDDPAINVFAVPPSAVYLTRGLFVYLDSEAELAAILGHAISHLGEGDVLLELEEADFQSVGLGLPARASRPLNGLYRATIPGLELLAGAYRPKNDRRADALTMQALERSGYDLNAPAAIYAVLEQLEGVDPPGRLPDWWMTHPGPEKRSAQAAREAGTFPESHRSGTVGHESFLNYLDGIVFGWNLTRPFFQNSRYFNPEAGFRMDFPGRWKRVQIGHTILAVSPEGDALIHVSPTGHASNVEALRELFDDDRLDAKRSWRHSVNNISAVWATFDFRQEERDLEGRVGFVTVGETVYRLLGFGLERLWIRHFTDVQNTFEGIRKIKAPEGDAKALESARIEFIEMESDMSLSQLEEEFPSATGRRNVRALNRLMDGRRAAVGEIFKRVVGGLDAVKEEEDEDAEASDADDGSKDSEGSGDDRPVDAEAGSADAAADGPTGGESPTSDVDSSSPPDEGVE